MERNEKANKRLIGIDYDISEVCESSNDLESGKSN